MGSKATIWMVGALVATALVAGCAEVEGNCTIGQAQDGQSGVCNETNSFAFGEQLSSQSGQETFSWENTEGQAQVAWGAQAGHGSVEVTILDADGQAVYGGSLSAPGQNGGSQATQEGAPGTWTIEIAFSNFTGQMGLSVQATS